MRARIVLGCNDGLANGEIMPGALAGVRLGSVKMRSVLHLRTISARAANFAEIEFATAARSGFTDMIKLQIIYAGIA